MAAGALDEDVHNFFELFVCTKITLLSRNTQITLCVRKTIVAENCTFKRYKRAAHDDESNSSQRDQSEGHVHWPSPFQYKVYIPSIPKKELALILKTISSLVPGLHVVDVDVPLNILCKDDLKLEQFALGREFHISLGRTVPTRVHQIDSVVAMLRQKLQFQKRSDYFC